MGGMKNSMKEIINILPITLPNEFTTRQGLDYGTNPIPNCFESNSGVRIHCSNNASLKPTLLDYSHGSTGFDTTSCILDNHPYELLRRRHLGINPLPKGGGKHSHILLSLMSSSLEGRLTLRVHTWTPTATLSDISDKVPHASTHEESITSLFGWIAHNPGGRETYGTYRFLRKSQSCGKPPQFIQYFGWKGIGSSQQSLTMFRESKLDNFLGWFGQRTGQSGKMVEILMMESAEALSIPGMRRQKSTQDQKRFLSPPESRNNHRFKSYSSHICEIILNFPYHWVQSSSLHCVYNSQSAHKQTVNRSTTILFTKRWSISPIHSELSQRRPNALQNEGTFIRRNPIGYLLESLATGEIPETKASDRAEEGFTPTHRLPTAAPQES